MKAFKTAVPRLDASLTRRSCEREGRGDALPDFAERPQMGLLQREVRRQASFELVESSFCTRTAAFATAQHKIIEL